VLTAVIKRRTASLSHHDLTGAALVFAPHPDDETLGCGGTVIRKIQAGARVGVVFMTDGSASHRNLVSENDLRGLRRKEALAACSILGVPPERVWFMDFRDGDLSACEDEATGRVVEIFRQHEVEQVFVPYSGDLTADHVATRSIILRALRRTSARVTVYEYPVWFWLHWPWTSVQSVGIGRMFRELTAAVRCWAAMAKDLRYSVTVDGVLAHKRKALECHRTQVERLMPASSWPILGDVSNGEFLGCFFQDFELFRRYMSDSAAAQ
jgi:LmbE family N-acetylglucosaminyl deacetylase